MFSRIQNSEAFINAHGWNISFLTLIVFSYCIPVLAASPRIPLVVVDEARTAAVIKQVPLTGTITSPKVSRLSAQVSGRVKQLKVEVGDQVNEGDIILAIDSELEELTFQATRAATQQARAELMDARRRYEKAKKLRKQKSISENEIELREAEVQIDQAALQKLVAEERKQQALVDRYTVEAPFAGVISERFTEIGEWIGPGTPVVTLVAMKNLRAEFRVPQEYYTDIKDQSRVSVTLDTLAALPLTRKINKVVPVSDPSARTFLIHVLIDKNDVKIMPGMSVQGQLHLDTGRQGVVISRDALLRYPDGRVTVWVVTTAGKNVTVSEQPVKIGRSFDGQVSISEGLQAGDRIVVRGNESLQEGQSVSIQSSR